MTKTSIYLFPYYYYYCAFAFLFIPKYACYEFIGDHKSHLYHGKWPRVLRAQALSQLDLI